MLASELNQALYDQTDELTNDMEVMVHCDDGAYRSINAIHIDKDVIVLVAP